MWRLLDFRQNSLAWSKLTARLPILSSGLRRFELHLQSRSILVSDVFGADAYHASGRASPANNDKSFAQGLDWDSALDFSAPQTSNATIRLVSSEATARGSSAGNAADVDEPPFFEDEDPAQKVLLALAAAWQHARRGIDIAVRKLGAVLRSRGPALALAAVVVLLWIGVGRSTPLQPPRNSGADALADRFSRSEVVRPEPSLAAPQGDSAVASSDLSNDQGPTSVRFNFAPKLGGLLLDSGGSDDAGSQPFAPDSNSETHQQPAGENAGDVETGTIPVPGDAASVRIRNLPAGTQLSKGTQVSTTEWTIARNDLNNVVVTLPANRRGAVKAEIDVLSATGQQIGSMMVEIREQRVKTSSGSRRVHVYRPAGEKEPLPATLKKQAALASGFAPKTGTSQLPASTAQAAAPAITSPKSMFPQLPFFPSPAGTILPQTSDGVGREIMINLGIVPRT